MDHGIALIATVAAAFGAALILGLIAVRLRLPALVGYLVAGVLLGPATPGFHADLDLSRQLAEIGVMLLMFGVGLHFSLDDLKAVRRIALPGALLQIFAATLLGMLVAHYWGWTLGAGLVFGLALSVASTVVLLKALQNRGIAESLNGRIAIGWLVVEDLVMVLVLVLLPSAAGWLGGAPTAGAPAPPPEIEQLLASLAVTLAQVGGFAALMLVVGRRLLPWLLWQVARTGSRELFTLAVVAAAVGVAYGSAVMFGVSFALGAFFAGMILRESPLSHRAADESLPLRDAFSVLFFVSVGMLFDPAMLLRDPLKVVVVVLIITVGKFIAAGALVLAFRYPLKTALTVSASLAQIGEFSFILAGLGVAIGVLPQEGQSLILAGALISIALNPLLFGLIDPLVARVQPHTWMGHLLDRPGDVLAELPLTVDQSRLSGHIVLVGYGRVGGRIAGALRERDLPLVIAEQNRETVEWLRARDILAVSGDAAEPVVLIQAHVARAQMLVIAVPDTLQAIRMIEIARMLRPGIHIVARAHTDEDAKLLRKEGAGQVLMGEHELALGMTREVLERIGAPSGPDPNLS